MNVLGFEIGDASVKSVAGATSSTLNIILLVVVLIGIIVVIMHFMRFKHIFIVRQLTGGQPIIINDRARELKNKEGVKFWRLLRHKETISIPPARALGIGRKGVKFVEAYRTEDGNYIYINDTGLKDYNEKEITETFQPLTTPERLILVNQIKQAMSRGKKDWRDTLLQIAPMVVLAIVVIAILAMWGDITKPSLDAKAIEKSIVDSMKELTQAQIDLKHGIQRIETEVMQGNEVYPIEPPD